jgi:hypothetical protein
MKRSDSGRYNRKTNKLWLMRNYLKKVNKERDEHIDIRGKKDLWKS